MPPLADPHDPGNEIRRLDGIVLAALGEPVDPWLREHLESCAQCAQERADLAHTVRLARETVEPLTTPDVRPPASVWAGIAAELGLPPAASDPRPETDGPAHRDSRHGLVGPRRHRSRSGPVVGRSWLLAAVVVLALFGATAVGYALGHRGTTTSASCPGTKATLAQMPGGPSEVAGRAAVVCSPDGPALRVTTSKLPLRSGFYEVWLYAPSTNTMVAIGTLGADGAGSFTLPAGVNLQEFHVVDVSAQKLNGNPAHDQSVLRGALTS